MLNSIKFDDDMNPIGFDEELCERLMLEKNEAEEELERIIEEDSHESMAESKIDEMLDIIAALKKHPRDWDDIMIRQLIDRVIIEDEHTLRVIFASGFEAYQTL